jgi:hypothetical protein
LPIEPVFGAEAEAGDWWNWKPSKWVLCEWTPFIGMKYLRARKSDTSGVHASSPVPAAKSSIDKDHPRLS